MMELKIVASLQVKLEYKEELMKALYNVVDYTRKESGNISYDLHQDIENPLQFVILEVWESKEAIEIHKKMKHYLEFKKTIEGKLDSFSAYILSHIY